MTETATTGIYVYGVTRLEDAHLLPAGGLALDPAFPLELVAAGDLVALCSEIGREAVDLGGGEELEPVERTARCHAEILDRCLEVDALLPFRLGTVFADRQGLRLIIEQSAGDFEAQLARLGGAREWGVKGYVSLERLSEALVGRDPELDALARAAEGDGGAAFFSRRQLAGRLDEQMRNEAEAAAADLHLRISELSRDNRLNPAQPRQLARSSDEMILNGAYLLARGSERRLVAAVDEFEAAWGDGGYSVELTGPWPPYNFVGGAPTAPA